MVLLCETVHNSTITCIKVIQFKKYLWGPIKKFKQNEAKDIDTEQVSKLTIVADLIPLIGSCNCVSVVA